MPSNPARTNRESIRCAAAPGGTAAGESTILVVDDEWSIRRFVCGLLNHATTALVIDAADPDAAVSLARRIGRPIGLLISDINLGAAKNGIDLARELCDIHPSMKVLLMSGDECPQGEIPAAWRFLAKPFPVTVFADCVSALCRSAGLPRARAGNRFAA